MNHVSHYPLAGAHHGQATIYGGPLQQVGYTSTVQQGYPPQGYGPQIQSYPPSYQARNGGPQQQAGYRTMSNWQQHYAGGPPPQQQGYGPQALQQQGYGSQTPLQQGALPPVGKLQDSNYLGSNVADQAMLDDDEHYGAAPPQTAPPADMLGRFAGYENTNFGTDYLPPPPPREPPPQQPTPEQNFLQATAITSNQAREALLAFVAENCCYGKRAARDMEIKEITPASAFHYKLESYCESRSTSWKFDPYWGQQIDGPQNGPAPTPWSIPVQPTQFFKPHEAYVEVPHTASVKPCHVCKAKGIVCCYGCHGRKKVQCTYCHGTNSVVASGPNNQRSCPYCTLGKIKCPTCQGKGRITCRACDGQRRLKMYILLTVKWECHADNSVTEKTDLPRHLIIGSPGMDIFTQELPMVYPITAFHDQDVNSVSRQLVEAHSRTWPTKRIIRQRQTLRAVPVSHVKYDWKDTSTRFWVYGLDHKVHAPDYPQQCCCGCAIL